jgi:hypothetical protein
MRVTKLCSLMAAAALAGAAACSYESSVAFDELPSEEFDATLAGANEIPPVVTTASGTTLFAVLADSILAFRVNVAGIDSTTLAHIHQGDDTTAGPILVDLFIAPAIAPTGCTTAQQTSPRCRIGFTGPLSQGQVRASQLTKASIAGFGATPRERFDSLVVLLRTGGVYVNVHNVANPTGHMRGQTAPQP